MNAPTLPRVFRYNSIELEDPGPEHDPIDVRNLYSATYPEILNAAIEGPEAKDGKRVYTFRKAVGTKGADVRAELQRIVRGQFAARAGTVTMDTVKASGAAFGAWAEFVHASRDVEAERLEAPAELLAPLA